MKDRETELLERWQHERPVYDAWGSFVSGAIESAIAKEIHPVRVELFFRIPVKHRTKDAISLVAKAFHRGKGYANPYEDIEDKVGLRIVVLFSQEIRLVENAIISCDHWTAMKARDFEDERLRKPYEFDYQSLHYIVRSKGLVRHRGIEVSPDTPCEVQVRTILQHAYSELTHDTIYKPNVQAEPDVKRAAAKSMALIEATDDYFNVVQERLAKALAPGRQVEAALNREYKAFTELEPEPSPLNTLLIDHYKRQARESFDAEIAEFLRDKSFLKDFICERAPAQLLYRQPAVLLVYWAIKQAPRIAAIDSPLSADELAPLYSDLGERLPEART
jgi:putative GTP pyrophosphokinase